MSEERPLPSVVVPWWDHGELLQLWRTNVAHLSDCQIIFIDNGSAPPTANALREFAIANNIALIRNETNRGFSAANNQGAAAATTPFLIFLNNDVQLFSPIAPTLCETATQGVAGTQVLMNDLYCPYVEGWCFCIARDQFQRLGGWAEQYTLGYWDDVDLSTRAAIAGLPLIAAPGIETRLRHLQNVTGRDGRIDQLALDSKNRRIFVRRFFSTQPKIVIDAAILLQPGSPVAQTLAAALAQWANTDFAKHLLILDRGGAVPKRQGLRYRRMEHFISAAPESDRKQLDTICDEECASLFVATTPTRPSSVKTFDLSASNYPLDALRQQLHERATTE